MAKKYQQRTHVSVRRKKEEAQKLAKRRAFYKKYQKHILIGLAALVFVILVGSLAFDYFYAPDGSMRVFMGNLLGAEETSIIKDLGTAKQARYYDLGDMTKPEGYEEAEYGLTSTAVTEERKFYYETTDENRTIQNVYVAGVANKNGAEMMETVTANNMYATMSEPRTGEIAGHPVNYVYVQGQPDAEDVNRYYSALVIYVDTIRNSSVLVNCASDYFTPDQVPAEEALLAEAEAILACLTVNK